MSDRVPNAVALANHLKQEPWEERQILAMAQARWYMQRGDSGAAAGIMERAEAIRELREELERITG